MSTPLIEPQDLQQLLGTTPDDVVLLDVRDVDEWIAESSSPYGKDFCPRKGRLPEAVWIEWYHGNPCTVR
ncbi:hypothetical protein [Guyparkeria halopsychrophila]|uniref:hypothetical protein n=1 Tax=Guyparkeria halopsychrophila TaxID=3139421 RepID=UPI0037CA3E82